MQCRTSSFETFRRISAPCQRKGKCFFLYLFSYKKIAQIRKVMAAFDSFIVKDDKVQLKIHHEFLNSFNMERKTNHFLNLAIKFTESIKWPLNGYWKIKSLYNLLWWWHRLRFLRELHFAIWRSFSGWICIFVSSVVWFGRYVYRVLCIHRSPK